MRESIFAVYKPKGISSYDVIRKLKNNYPGEKIGHGGTLDPLAEGVLVVGVGKNATKKLHHILHGVQKEYIAEILLGKTSESDDAEGPIIDSKNNAEPTLEEIKSVLKQFTGEIKQIPPRFSAVKVKGQPAYKLARKGIQFTLQPKKVQIETIKIASYNYPLLKIKAKVGSGTYIRSLARDIGEKLETGAYLHSLIRSTVGQFTRANAKKLI